MPQFRVNTRPLAEAARPAVVPGPEPSMPGRAQVFEHVDWRVWRNWFQQGDGTESDLQNVVDRTAERECRERDVA